MTPLVDLFPHSDTPALLRCLFPYNDLFIITVTPLVGLFPDGDTPERGVWPAGVGVPH